MKKHYLVTLILLLAVVALAAVLGVKGGMPGTNAPGTMPRRTTAEAAATRPPPLEITLMAVGDNLIHKPLIDQARSQAGGSGYDFARFYDGVRSLIARADLAVINQESILAGDVAAPSSYPMFCTPTQCGDAIYDLGFRAILTANNHMLDKGTKGILASLDYWDGKPGAVAFGSYRNEDEFNTPRVLDVNGITFAFTGATYGYNGLQFPQGSGIVAPLVENEDRLRRAVEAGKRAADVMVVALHWGVEDSQAVTDQQRALARRLADWGADIILGTHPHVLQAMEFIDKAGGGRAFAAYSLGNFLSGQAQAPNLIGGALELTVKKDGGAVTITAPRCHPVITHYGTGFGNVRLIAWPDYTPALASSHGVRGYDSRFGYTYIENLLRRTIPEDILVMG
ncbi:MAG: CapA family protein [Oscillospiraceae bacterium]|jgi:poly-gamma-glutamate synthesis protein (capsule biosynthesis protein)|nr:CapA family protein [Oscillospiraceae bacterium]